MSQNLCIIGQKATIEKLSKKKPSNDSRKDLYWKRVWAKRKENTFQGVMLGITQKYTLERHEKNSKQSVNMYETNGYRIKFQNLL